MFIVIAWLLVIGILGSSDPLVDKWMAAATLICVILHFVQLELRFRAEHAARLAKARS